MTQRDKHTFVQVNLYTSGRGKQNQHKLFLRFDWFICIVWARQAESTQIIPSFWLDPFCGKFITVVLGLSRQIDIEYVANM